MLENNDNIIKRNYPVTGMSCASCALGVEKKLKQQRGVKSAAVNLADNSVMLEFETAENYDTTILRSLLEDQMPEGIALHSCEKMDGQKKSLAARTYEAEYIIGIPMGKSIEKPANELLEEFLAQETIMVPKKQKKSKQLKDVDIKDKIRFLNGVYEGENLILTANLDSGSDSNLSPELLIQALVKFMGIETERAEMNVLRTKIVFE